MWEPYAGLLLLHKPVDLILLNTDEHGLPVLPSAWHRRAGRSTGSASGCRAMRIPILLKPNSISAGEN